MTIGEASALVDRLRAAGRTVVFTNGVFDLLHVATFDTCSRRERSATR